MNLNGDRNGMHQRTRRAAHLNAEMSAAGPRYRPRFKVSLQRNRVSLFTNIAESRTCSRGAEPSVAPPIAVGEGWWSRSGSNRRPRRCERRALSTELLPRTEWGVLKDSRTGVNAFFRAFSRGSEKPQEPRRSRLAQSYRAAASSPKLKCAAHYVSRVFWGGRTPISAQIRPNRAER
jgi:hypothetical protein